MTRPTSEETKAQIFRLREQGRSYTATAAIAGVSRSTVRLVLRRAGIYERGEPGRKKAVAAAAAVESASEERARARAIDAWLIDMRRKHGYHAFRLRESLPDGLTVDAIRLAMVVVPEDHSYDWCRLDPAAVRWAMQRRESA